MSVKEDILDEITMILEKEEISIEISRKVTARISLLLKDYVIEKGSTELALREDDEDGMMVRKFFISKKLKGCTDRTIQFYTNELKRALPKFRKPLKEITVDDIRWFIADKEFNDGASRVTCSNTLRTLGSFFEFLTVEGYINTNPVKRFGVYKVEKKKEERIY